MSLMTGFPPRNSTKKLSKKRAAIELLKGPQVFLRRISRSNEWKNESSLRITS